jgi:hypothetical protein
MLQTEIRKGSDAPRRAIANQAFPPGEERQRTQSPVREAPNHVERCARPSHPTPASFSVCTQLAKPRLSPQGALNQANILLGSKGSLTKRPRDSNGEALDPSTRQAKSPNASVYGCGFVKSLPCNLELLAKIYGKEPERLPCPVERTLHPRVRLEIRMCHLVGCLKLPNDTSLTTWLTTLYFCLQTGSS